VQALIDLVDGFVGSGDIDANLANSLKSKLEAAMASLARGNENSARGQLNAFINQVEAQAGKKISDSAADELIAAAQAIVDGLGPGTPVELAGAPQATSAGPEPVMTEDVQQAEGKKGNPHGKSGH